MAKVRTGRVSEQIKKELSLIIQAELKDPRIGFLTVTGVEITNDLSEAKVYLSVLGTDQQKEDTLNALGRGTGFIRTELGKRIRLRIVPKLFFILDSSIAYGSKIEQIISKLNEGKTEL
jgi:ribosome-binding factor A